jgi:hypothetical protein
LLAAESDVSGVFMGEKEMREPDQMSLRYAGIIKKGARSDDGLSSQYLMGLSGEVFFGQHLRSLHCLELFEEEDGELIVRTFFFLDLLKEIAFLAIVVLFREESLFLPSFTPPCEPSSFFSTVAGQMPSFWLMPPGSRPQFMVSQQFFFRIISILRFL